jgi:NitT/TauT family transport system permease protein
VSEGVRAADPRLVEMARVFHMRRRERISGIYFPALLPFLVSGASACLGLIWKVVVAGEVLSLPARAIGTGLHEAKIYLDTSRAMAWALSAVILCALTDAAFALVSRCLRRSAGQVSRSGGLMGSARDGASHAD